MKNKLVVANSDLFLEVWRMQKGVWGGGGSPPEHFLDFQP